MSAAIGTKRGKLAASGAPDRIDVIQLFGMHKLRRDGNTSVWMFTNGTAKPVRLTKRTSMFINAALHAARGRHDHLRPLTA